MMAIKAINRNFFELIRFSSLSTTVLSGSCLMGKLDMHVSTVFISRMDKGEDSLTTGSFSPTPRNGFNGHGYGQHGSGDHELDR